ncbi:hypothetical protein HPB50_025335 [Hyalomma asiaticum]|uniref:Uncharacterized protein n=1 Tax=Hyalomma asiaticum TaxID=266040 RepID=A0ACB7SQ27_HYAAI|nr:hypothetical protein HPB50_025335 [Hyalomma asiaticum]
MRCRATPPKQSLVPPPTSPYAGNERVPCRWVLTAFLFSGLLLAYALRFSLSVALVAMVNQTANAHEVFGPVFAVQPTSATVIPAAAAEPGAAPANGTGVATGVPVVVTTDAPHYSRVAGFGQCPAPVQHQDVHNPTAAESQHMLDDDCNYPSERAGEGEFLWSPWTQGVVLGAFFYGYAATQMPGGWLAGRVGGKWPFGIGLLGTALGSLVTPAAARAHSSFSHDAGASALVAVRVLEGLGEGVTYPAMFSMVAEWAPPHERGSLLAVAYVGANVGAILAMPMTAMLCDTIGWEAAFYVFGLVGCAYFALYSWRVRSTPEEDPWISDAEYDYIALGRTARPLPPLQAKAVEAGSSDLLNVKEGAKYGTPWFHLLTSVPVWALTTSRFACLWGQFTVLTGLPTYLSAVLRIPLSKRSVLTSMRAAALTGAGLLLALVPSAGCSHVPVACLLVLAMGVYGLAAGGATPALVDMAPAHAGILYGIAGTVSNASGFLAPLVVGMVTSPTPTLSNWATVFYLTSGIFFLGALAFLMFGSAELQPWAQPPPPLETVATHIERQHADGTHRFDLTTSFAESFHMF